MGMVGLWLLWRCSSNPKEKLPGVPHVWPLACSSSPPLLCYFWSSTHSQIGQLCPVIKGLSQCKLLLFNRNIPTTSFLQAHISLASLSDWPAPGNCSPHSLSHPLEPERFSPKAATTPSTGKIHSLCDGRGAECPRSEVLGGLQQLASWASVLSQHLSALWSRDAIHVQSRRWKE